MPVWAVAVIAFVVFIFLVVVVLGAWVTISAVIQYRRAMAAIKRTIKNTKFTSDDLLTTSRRNK